MHMGWMLAGALVLITAAMILAVRRTRRAPAVIRETAATAPAETAATSAASPEEQAEATTRIFDELHKLAFGVRSLTLPRAHDEVRESVDAQLRAVSGELRHAPRRPLLLPQLLRTVNDSEASRQEITAIIGRDPALAANLLRLANSPFYRVKSQPVESIDRAVAVLGTNGIRSIISAALLQPVFRVSGNDFRDFPEMTWEHTFLVGAAAETFAAGTEADPFAAQLLGMLMGLGTLVVFRTALDQYARPEHPQASAPVIAGLIDHHSAAVAQRVARSWGLSVGMEEALEEQQDRARHDLSALGQSLRLGRLAGALALLRKADRVTEEGAVATLREFGATERQVERVWTRLQAATAD